MAKASSNDPAPRASDLVSQIKARVGDTLPATIYRDRVRTQRTRSYRLNAPARATPIEILHTLLGVELRIGSRRISCPDRATARYLSVFARLGVGEVAIPYDITVISRLADDLESGWFQILALIEHLTRDRPPQFRSRVRLQIVEEQRQEIGDAGAGPAIPEFIQNTRQRPRR